MVWSFGMNRSVPVINITDDTRKMIMYTCAHAGVLYDLNTNQQTLLQGHVSYCNKKSATSLVILFVEFC